MNQPPDPQVPSEFDDLIEAVLAGEIAPADPAVQALPEAERMRLEKMMRVRAALERDSAIEAELLAQVEEKATEEIPAEVQQFLEGIHSREGRPASPVARGPGRTAGAIAIAAGVALMVWAMWDPDPTASDADPGGSSGTLSGSLVLLEHPVGAVDQLSPLRWSGPLPALCKFEVHVWAEKPQDSAPSSTALLSSRPLSAHEWTAPNSLPERFWWRVDVIPFEGKPVPGSAVEAWKR